VSKAGIDQKQDGADSISLSLVAEHRLAVLLVGGSKKKGHRAAMLKLCHPAKTKSGTVGEGGIVGADFRDFRFMILGSRTDTTVPLFGKGKRVILVYKRQMPKSRSTPEHPENRPTNRTGLESMSVVQMKVVDVVRCRIRLFIFIPAFERPEAWKEMRRKRVD